MYNLCPKNPKTRPAMDEVVKFEAKWDYEKMIEDALNNVEVIYIKKDNDLF